MANIAPWYVGPIFLLIGLILITHIVVAEWIHRPLKSFWFWIPVALWLLLAGLSWEKYFEPKITANNVASARAIIAANTGQCVDLGRKQALENLADSHVDLGRIDVDCADLDNLNLPPNTKMEGFSFARGRALNAKFSGAELQGTFLSGTNFTNADFSEANMRGAVIGRHFLFDERTGKPLGCFQGANLTNANLKNANLDLVWLVGVKGLTCQRLMEAKNWSNTRRDPELTCGAIIPDLAKAYAYIETWPQKCDEK